MTKFIVNEIAEIKTKHVVEAGSASAAINIARNQKNVTNDFQSVEQHFTTSKIEGDIDNGK